MKHIYTQAQNIFWQKSSSIRSLVAILLLLSTYQGAFSQCYTAPSYCSPTASNNAGYGMGMTNVKFGTAAVTNQINNTTSANTVGAAGIYNYYSTQTVKAAAGVKVGLSITNASNYQATIKVFVDYNLDGTFNTSGSELINTYSLVNASSVTTDSFTVPSGQGNGVYRLRVIADYSNNVPGPCGVLAYSSECEDYNLLVPASTGDASANTFTSPASFVSGNNTIAFSMVNLTNANMTSVDIGYKLDNNSAVTQSLSSLSVASGGIYTATFSTQLNISSVGTYTLKMWLNNVNGNGTQTAANDTICRTFTYCTGLSGTYTINPSGSGSSNFLRFGQADSALINCGISGPVVFDVSAGTYTEQVTIPAITGASATNTITFNGGSGNASTRILTFPSTVSTANYTVNLSGAKYIRFFNMTITASNTTYGTALAFGSSAGYDSFYNVIFNGVTTSSNTPNHAVINGYNTANISNNMRFDTCSINNGAYGSYIASNSNSTINATSQGTMFNNCNFTNQYAYGIYNQYLDGVKLTKNRISTNSAFTSYIGMYTYWVMVLADTNKILITGNKITGAVGGYGMYNSYLAVNSSVNSARKPLVANNFIQIGSAANSTYGIFEQGTYGTDYVHNSVNIGTSQTTNGSAAGWFAGGSTGTSTFQNNIFAAYNGAPAIRFDNFTYYTTVNYNNYYTTGTNLCYLSGSAYTTLGAWKTATSKDANSQNLNPLYTSSTDLHMGVYCLRGVGGLGLITTDFDGQSRASTPNIGADEIASATSSNDVGVFFITSPSGTLTSGSSQTVKAIVKNFGTASVSSLTVYYKYNGGSAVSETFNFGTALAVCDTATVTFSTTITLAGGSSPLKVYTALSGDGNLSNDTAQATICTTLTGSYTINPGAAASSTNFTSFTSAVSALTCGGMSSTVTFTVSNGTYNESFSLSSIPGNTSSSNTITFTSASGNPALCIIQGLSTATYSVQMAGADYVTFNNIGFLTSTSGNARNVEFTGGSNSNTFNGCVFNSTQNTSNYHVYEQSVVDNFNTFSNNTFNAVGYAMYMATNGTRDQKWVISGNTFNNQYYAGVYLNYSDSINILNNTFNTSSATAYYSMYIANAGNAIKVLGNNITLSGAASYGIYFTSVTGTSTNRITIANNAIRGGTNGYYGIYVQSCSYIDLYHNTVNISGTSLTTSGCLYFASNNNFNIKNNLFSNAAAGYSVVVPAGNTFSAANVMDYNNYTTTGTNIALTSGTARTTYANFASAMSTAAGTTQNANSSNKTPLFVSAPSNLNISDGCLTGVSGTGITTDINSVTRSSSTPNMGAYEFSSLSDNLMVVAIRTPIPTVGTGLTNVVVTIKNVGNNSVTSGTIKYQYDNNTAISLSLPSTMNPCDTLQLTFNSTSGPGSTDQRLTVASGLHYLKAFTQSPNGNTDNDKTNDTTGFTTCTGGISGTSFTINPSVAASASNFTSFTSAVTAITACGGISGPVKFTVAAGTYTEQINLTGISGLSSTNTLAFDGGAGNAATRILQASGTASLPYTIRINNLSYISIKNLTIRGTGGNAWPVNILASSTVTADTIKNCIIDFGSTSVASFNSTNYMGIVLNGNATSYSTAGTFGNIIIDSNTIQGGFANIMVYANNSSSTGGNQFTGNACNNAYQYGVYLQGINAGTFDRNSINMNTNLASSSGLYLSSANSLASTNTWSIQRNSIINAGQYGIFLASTAANATSRGKIYNNLIGGGFRNTNPSGLYFSSSAYNWDVMHNTVNIDNAATSTSAACIYMGNCCTTGATLLDVRNNIFAVTNSASSAVPFYMPNGYIYAVIGTSSFDYNLLYVAGANAGTTYGYNAGTLLTASTVLGNSSYNTNSIIGNPYLYSNTDLHIGITSFNVPKITAVGADYSGTSRGSSTDVGAYETPALNNDLGITAMTAPAAPISAGNNNVTVTIKNYGANTVNTADVSYSVNGGSPVTVALTSMGLASGATMSYSFTGGNQFNFSSGTNYVFKTYTGSPNGVTDAFSQNDTFISPTTAVAICGNFTINQGAAASSSNFVSFNSAVSTLVATGVSCATTFTVMGTTPYTEQVDLSGIPGLSASNTVTFDGGTGNAANRILQAAGTASLPYTLRLKDQSYIIVKNLTIRGTSTNAWPVQIMGSSSYDTIKNCIVDFGSTAISSFNSTNYQGIVLNGSATSYSATGGFNNVIIDSNTIQGGYANIIAYDANNSTTGGNQFTGNSCNNAYQYGIYLQGINGGIVDRNIINMNTNLTSSTGLYISSANALASTNSWSIQRNKITNAGQYGIFLASTGAHASSRGKLYNNLIGGGFRSTGLNGIYFSNSAYNWDVFHNTINLDFAATSTSSACLYLGNCCTTGSTTLDVRNNLLAVTATGSTAMPFYMPNGYLYAVIGSSSFDYNLLYVKGATSTTNYGYNAGTYLTSSTVIGDAGNNSNSVIGNPYFTSNTDLHVGNAANNAPKITTVGTDYSGTSRGSSTDMGAYETPAQNNDIGISVITAPVFPVTAGNNNITVTLKNYGANTVTSANVSYSVNGGSAVSVALSSISLAANGGTGTYTFTGGNQFNFAANTSYIIKAFTASPNGVSDAFAANDTFTSSPIGVALCGSYTINQGAAASATNFTSFLNAVNSLNSGGISCPVNFTVMGATAYNEQVELLSIQGASTTNTITFDGGAGNAANRTIYFAASAQASSYTIRINNTPGVIIRNLTIQATGTTYGWPVHILGNAANNSKVKSCIINYGGSNGTNSTSTNFCGIVLNNSTTGVTGGQSTATGFELDSNTISGGNTAMYLYCNVNYNATKWYARNNTISNTYQYGLYIYANSSFTISRNTITMRTGYASSSGLSINYCYGGSNCEISYNTVTNAGQYGIYYIYAFQNASTTPGKMFNNMIGGGFSSTSAQGIYLAYGQHWDVDYNTVNLDVATSSAIYSAFYVDPSYSYAPTNMRNNIFAYTAGSGSGLPVYFGTITGLSTFNYNDYFSAASTNLIYHNGTTYTTSTYTTVGANSKNINPSFTSSTNLRHTTSTLKAGVTGTGISDDIDGRSRSSTTPYIGAYEVPVNNDLGASILVSPSLPTLAGTFDVTVRFKNFGANNVTSGTVGYIFNGGSAVTTSYSGTLVPLDTSSKTFTGGNQITISSGSTNTLKVFAVAASEGNASNDTLTFTICAGLSGTYTIDTTQANSSTNFKSFNRVVNILSGCGGVAGPITFNVSGNTYSEQVSIGAINGTSATNTVTFVGTDTTNTILTFAGSSASTTHTVLFNGCQYVTFRNMRIRATGATYAVPVYFNNANNNKVGSCVVDITNAPTSSSAAGAVFSGSSSSFSTTSNCNNNYLDSNRISSGYYGVYHAGNNGSVVNYIRNNYFQNSYYYGVYQNSSSMSSNKILNNTFQLATGNANSSCIYLINGTPATGFYHEIKGNTFIRTGQYHIYILTSQGGASAGVSGEITNNFFGGSWNNTSTAGCINMYGQNWKIYNNSFYMTGTANSSACFSVWGGTNTIDVRNNIMANAQTGGSNFAADINNTAAVSIFNNNILYGTGVDILRIGGNTYQSGNLASAAFPNGAGTGSSYQLPAFASSTDLHITNSCNNGVNLGVTTDIDGQTRSSMPDIGADEYTGVANDVGVSAIVTPSFPLSAGTQNVVALIKNFGSDSLSSLTVYYKLNSNSVVSQSFSFSPALQQCDTSSITFTTQATIVIGSNNLKVYTAKSGDAVTNNDTSQFTLCPALNGTYTINPSGSGTTNYTSFTAASAALQCGGLGGLVTFNVSTGVYTEQLIIPTIVGASATNQIVFQSATSVPSDVVITYSGTSTNNYTVGLIASKYIYFKNMTITATNSTYGTALLLSSGASYDSFYNVTLNGVSTTTNSTNLAVITIPSSSISNFVYFDTCRINNGAYGTYIQSSSSNSFGASSRGTGINNCDFTNQYAYGMYHQYLDGIKITNNRITTNSSLATYYGMYNYWIMVLADASKTYITGNKISGGQGGYGMYCYYMGVNSSVTAARRYLVANNFIEIGTGSNATYGLYDQYGNGVDYIYNTVSNGTSSNANTSAAGYFAATVYGTNTIQNNIFAGLNGAAAIRMDNNTYYPTCDYNDLFTTGTNLGYYSTTGYATIGTWRTASSRDANSKNIRPDFLSTSDLHVTNKACMNNFGTNLSTLMAVDIDAQSRSTTPDFGADEFTPLSYDIALQTILIPVSTSISASTNYNIKVRIKNNGSTTISSVVLNYMVTGSSAVSETFTPSTALAACDTATYTFTTGLTFPSGSSTLKVYSTTMNSGNSDQDNSNDTLQNIYCTPFTGTITVNPAVAVSSTNFATISSAASRLNSCGISGNIIVDISDGQYTENIVFSGQIPGASPTSTVTFRPASGDTGVWINSFTGHLVNLNGVKYVKFDGRAGGTGTSRIMNLTQTSSAFAAVNFINDAVRDTIRYCNMYSNTSAGVGTVTIGTTNGTIGNDSNTVEYCLFDKSTGNTANHIYALGTAAKENDYITINNNIFLNAFLPGSTTVSALSMQGNNRYWNVLDNKFTQTSINLPVGAVTSNLTSILVNSATEVGHLIQGNRIGGNIAGISGSVYQIGDASVVSGQLNQVLPIRIGNTSSTTTLKLYSNVLKDMKVHTNYSVGLASGFLGILVSVGNVEIGGDGPATGNIVGDSSLAANIEVIAYNSAGGQRTNGIRILGGITSCKIKNNMVAGLSFKNVNSSSTTVNEVIAIQQLSNGANTTCYIDSNFIGSNEISNSLQNENGSFGATLVGGIQANPNGSSHIHYIRSNSINSLYNGYTGSSAVNNTFGIVAGSAASTAIFKIDSNNVSYLASNDSNVSTGISASVIGIGLSSGTTQSNPEILRNTVSNLSSFKGNTSMYGIFYNNSGTGSQVSRNKVYALSNSSNTGTFTNISGIYNSLGNGVTVANNQISLIQNGSSTNSMIGISDNTSTNTQNYHYNTVYIAGSQSGIVAGSTAFGRAGSGSTLNIRNNILYNSHTSAGTNYIYTIPTAWSSTTSLYNFFASADTSNSFYVSGTTTTHGFSSWTINVSDGSGNTSANTTTNVIASNFFKDAVNGNLNINSDYCEVNNKGTAVGTTNDIDGETRSGSTPDIGADEFNMNFDLGVSSIKTPTSGLNRTSTELVKVWVKNYSSTITVPAGTNFKAGFIVDGVTVSIQNLTTVSSINVGDSQLFTFTATANVGAYTTHTMKAWTQICDGTASNDSTSSIIINQLGDNLGVTAMLSPGTSCIYGPNQTVSFRFKNLGYDTVKMAINNVIVRTKVTIPGGSIVSLPDVTLASGTMLPGDSLNATPTNTFNMSTTGNYIFKSYTIYALDVTHTDDTLIQTIAVVAPLALPYTQDFNASTSTPSGWTLATGFSVGSGTGAMGTNGIRINNNSATLNGLAILPKVGALSATSAIQFDYKITDVSGGGATTLTSEDSLLLQISTDCGVTYNSVSSINASNHTATTSFTTILTSISSYSGQNVILRLVGKTTGSTTSNYYLDIDNINVYNQAAMSYVTSNVTQNNLSNVLRGTNDAEVLRLKVVTTGNITPLVVNNIRFVTAGTTNVADLVNAKIFFTSNNNIYNTATQVGSTVSSPNGYVVVNFTTPVTLGTGNNYFWLSYTVSPTAPIGNKIDAYIDYLTVNSNVKMPIPKTAVGDRMVYYCSPVHVTGCGLGFIDGVQLGTINNTGSGCSSTSDSSWSNYFTSNLSSRTTNLRGNNNYTLTFTNSAKPQKVVMWIDYNRNGIYDISEYTLISSNVASSVAITYDITMPASVTAGTAGMRIRTVDTNTVITAADACASFANGETEDYKVSLQAPCDWVGGFSTLWYNPSNWASNSVPTAADNVRIPAIATFMPWVTGASYGKDITIDTGATVTIVAGGTLYVVRNYYRYGMLDHVGGSLTLYTPQSIPADTHVVLSINGVGTYTLQGNSKINNQLFIGTGTILNDGGNVITIAKDIMNNGTHTGTGKMVFAGTASQSIAGTSNIYKNIEFVSAFTVRAVSNMTVTGNLGLNPGSLTYQGVNLNLGTFTSTDSIAIYGTGNVMNTTAVGMLSVLGDTGAAKVVGLRVQTKGTIFIHRLKGVRLGGNLTCDGALMLDSGVLDLNGFNATIGTTTTASSSLITTGGALNNSSSTAGTLNLYGAIAATPISNLKIGSQFKVY
ncbi:MAG: GEVED domain-containing protein, partial [Bacteroidota bacterium]|nr:GEVED domain-containing protein [Bacteroidota bacterium]